MPALLSQRARHVHLPSIDGPSRPGRAPSTPRSAGQPRSVPEASPQPDPAARLLTVAELAGYLNVSVAWVRKGVLERTLPFTKLGKNIRFTHEQVEQILTAGEHPPLRTAGGRPPGRGSARTRL